MTEARALGTVRATGDSLVDACVAVVRSYDRIETLRRQREFLASQMLRCEEELETAEHEEESARRAVFTLLPDEAPAPAALPVPTEHSPSRAEDHHLGCIFFPHVSVEGDGAASTLTMECEHGVAISGQFYRADFVRDIIDALRTIEWAPHDRDGVPGPICPACGGRGAHRRLCAVGLVLHGTPG